MAHMDSVRCVLNLLEGVDGRQNGSSLCHPNMVAATGRKGIPAEVLQAPSSKLSIGTLNPKP